MKFNSQFVVMKNGEATKDKPWVDLLGTQNAGFLKLSAIEAMKGKDKYWKRSEGYTWAGGDKYEFWLPGFDETIWANWLYIGKGKIVGDGIYDNYKSRATTGHSKDELDYVRKIQAKKGKKSLRLYHFLQEVTNDCAMSYEALLLYAAEQQGWSYRKRGESFLFLPKALVNCQTSEIPVEAIEDFFDLTQCPDLRNFIKTKCK